jgi:hypothetical protein
MTQETLAQPAERNFCPGCGKRVADLTAIHTCTPPLPVQPVALVIEGVLVKSALPEKYTGHLYTHPPQPVQKPINEAVIRADEREACAKLAELAEPYQTADLIRARGQA